MDVPASILSIVTKINDSEDRWKARYIAVWRCSRDIKKEETSSNWKKQISYQLPASKSGHYEYTPEKLYSILISKDVEFTLGHLQTLFTLFEEMIWESSKILCTTPIKADHWAGMEKFFKEIGFGDISSDPRIAELKLAKQTRNCWTHKNGKIDEIWLMEYTNIRKCAPSAKLHDPLEQGFPNVFHQIEAWHALIVETTNRIKQKIESM